MKIMIFQFLEKYLNQIYFILAQVCRVKVEKGKANNSLQFIKQIIAYNLFHFFLSLKWQK